MGIRQGFFSQNLFQYHNLIQINDFLKIGIHIELVENFLPIVLIEIIFNILKKECK
jgi:hypothetical protein